MSALPSPASPEQHPSALETKPIEMPWVTSWRYAVGKFFRPFDPWHWLGSLGVGVFLNTVFETGVGNIVLYSASFLVIMECMHFIRNFLVGPPALAPLEDAPRLPDSTS